MAAAASSRFGCTVEGCGKSFTTRGILNRHVRSVHDGVRPFKCTVEGCGKEFRDKGYLNIHVRSVHEGSRPFECNVEGCGKTFSSNQSLNAHVRGVHEGARPFKCTVEGCGKPFTKSLHLKTHVRSVHEGLRPFKCTVEGCGKSFTKSSYVNVHVRSVHEGVRSFKCTVKGCGKTYSERSKLNTHVRIVHEGARPFKCTVEGCGKSFTVNGSLNVHVRSVHEGVRPFKCTLEGCGKSFHQRGGLNYHVRNVHEKTTHKLSVAVAASSSHDGISDNVVISSEVQTLQLLQRRPVLECGLGTCAMCKGPGHDWRECPLVEQPEVVEAIERDACEGLADLFAETHKGVRVRSEVRQEMSAAFALMGGSVSTPKDFTVKTGAGRGGVEAKDRSNETRSMSVAGCDSTEPDLVDIRFGDADQHDGQPIERQWLVNPQPAGQELLSEFHTSDLLSIEIVDGHRKRASGEAFEHATTGIADPAGAPSPLKRIKLD